MLSNCLILISDILRGQPVIFIERFCQETEAYGYIQKNSNRKRSTAQTRNGNSDDNCKEMKLLYYK